MSNLGSPDLITSNFYSTVDDAFDFYPGQICLAHTFRPERKPIFLEVDQYDPLDDSKSTFTLKSIQGNIPKSHMPLKNLKLEKDEFLYVVRGKIRPVVVLGKADDRDWANHSGKEKPVYFCLPLYSLKEQHNQAFVIKVQAFQFPAMFYLPASTNGLNEEGVARFERVLPIPKGCLAPLKNVANDYVSLSDQAYKYLICHYMKFISGQRGDGLKELLDVADFIMREYGDALIREYKQAVDNVASQPTSQ